MPLCLAAAAPYRVELCSVRGRGGSRVSLVGVNAAQDSAEPSSAAVLRGRRRDPGCELSLLSVFLLLPGCANLRRTGAIRQGPQA